ncbi:MAG: hypothetical protein Tsb009_17310 [Planctomycetaceae bacterium]
MLVTLISASMLFNTTVNHDFQPTDAYQQTTLEVESHAEWVTSSELSLFVQWVSLFLAIVILLLLKVPIADGKLSAEIIGLLLISISGGMLVGLANHLVLVFMGMELAAMPVMFAQQGYRTHLNSRQVSTRNHSLGFVASLLLLWGFCFVYGLAGSNHLDEIQRVFTESYIPQDGFPARGSGSVLGVTAIVMIFAAMGIRLSAAPFHLGENFADEEIVDWTLELVELLPRMSAILVVIRIGLWTMVGFERTGMLILTVLAFGTLLVGSIAILSESKLRPVVRSVVGIHFGFVLVGLAVAFWNASQVRENSRTETGPLVGLPAALIFLFIIPLTMSLLAGGFTLLQQRMNKPIEYLDDLKGTLRGEPFVAVALLFSLLTLMGLPPFPGFGSRVTFFLSGLSTQMESPETLVPLIHGGILVLTILSALAIFCIVIALIHWIASIVFFGTLGRIRSGGAVTAYLALGLCLAVLIGVGLFYKQFEQIVRRISLPPKMSTAPLKAAIHSAEPIDIPDSAESNRIQNPNLEPGTWTASTGFREANTKVLLNDIRSDLIDH